MEYLDGDLLSRKETGPRWKIERRLGDSNDNALPRWDYAR
jgi:hypothetical protein